jgi:hypothetical protein
VVRFGPALKAFVLCLLIGGTGVGYVWQKNQIYELGKQIRLREQRLNLLTKQNRELRGLAAMMRLPRSLEPRIKKLGLVAPDASQIWRLTEPSRMAPEPGRELESVPLRDYAARSP